MRSAIHQAQDYAQQCGREPNDVDLLHALLQFPNTPATDSLVQLQVDVSELLRAIDRYRTRSDTLETQVEPVAVIVKEAQDAARRLHWTVVGVEHLLLGLRAGGNDVKGLLASRPDDAEAILDGVEEVVRRLYSEAPTSVASSSSKQHVFVLSPGQTDSVMLIDQNARGGAIIKVLEVQRGQVHISIDAPENWLLLPTKRFFTSHGS